MFSFQMTIMIKDEEKELNQKELDFFLKGNTSLDQVQKPRPYKWVPEQGWKDMQKLVTIGEEFKNLIEDLERNERDWKKWYDLEKPETE
jgi:dynein heavy chain